MRKGSFSSALKIAQNANFAAWPSKTVTFWFYDQPSDLPSFYGPLSFAASMQQLSINNKQYILTKLADLGTFTDITFTPGASASASDLTFGGIRVGGGTYGWSSLGANDSNAGGLSSKSGDVWLNFDVLEGHPQYVPGNGRDDAIFKVIPHELGHALGLSHTHVGGDKSAPISGLTSEENTGRYSIMSYNRSVEENAVPYAYQLYDVAALQYLYGRNDDHEASNSLYSVFHQQVPSGDSERIGGDIATSVDRMFAIWDAGGVDTISNENYETSAVIDLRPGYFSSIGAYNNVDALNRTAIVGGLIFNAGPENISIAFGAYIENAKGGSNSDALIGNLLSNDLDGGGGDDLLFGEGRIRPDEQHSRFLGVETGNYDGEYDRVAQGGRDGPSGDVQPFVSDPSLQRDHLSGGGGNDQLWGGRGKDTLEGGTGENLLVGGPNYDTVSFGKELLSGLALKLAAGSGEADSIVQANSNAFDRDAIVQAVVTRPGVSVDTLLEMEQVVLTDYSDKVAVTELGDPDGARPMSALSINFLSAGKGRTANSYYRIDDDQLDFSQAGRAITYSVAGIPLASGERGVRVDLRDASNQTVQYYTKWDPVIGFDYHTRSDVMLRAANANSVIGTKYDDVLIGESGKVGTNGGYSTLRGEDGNDMLVGAGWESHLFGGKGADHFEMGANSWIEDGTTNEGDSVSYLGIPLYGGVSQWWNEGHYAYWAGFSSLTAAFPVVGSELLYTASFFIDAVTMKFVRYRLDANNTLEMNFGWGQAGQAAVKNYSLDLDNGRGTAGLTVFTVEQATAPKGTTGERLRRYVNLALKAGFGTCLFGVDPLVLDLDGDGFELTTEQNSQVWFDSNHNGFAQHTGWVRGDDGFLVRDANANGLIDDISEMFGNPTTAGFDVLAGYDANQDGLIDASDAIFASLQVWQDLNQNGVTDAGELKTLAELGIVSISLAATTPASPTTIGRNQVVHESAFTLTNGTTRKIGDVVFDVSTSNTHYLGDVAIDAASAVLPQLSGFGLVKDLRVATTQDVALKAQVSAFVANTTTDLVALKSGAEAILYAWAGVQSVATTAIGSNGFDARKLAFLEKYVGTALMPRDAQGVPLLDNLAEVEQLWTDQVTRLTLRLAVQGPLAASFAEITYRPDLDLLVATSPTALADILHRVVAGLPSDHTAATVQWAGWAPLLGALTESMVRADANTVRVDFLFQQLARATDGVVQPLTIAELASGLGIGNLHVGGSGGEALVHSAGESNIFYGAGGADTLTGGSGQDVYVFGRQVGSVVINDSEPNPAGDRIRFAFLNAADVRVERDQNDLLITVRATNETIRVTGQFAPVVPLGSDVLLSSNKGVEDIQFADGTIWEEPEIAAAVGAGTDGNDHLIGSMHSDVLTGGKGDDFLEGGDDADVYVFNAGDGHDIISDTQTTPLLRAADLVVFGDGIAPEDLVMSRTGDNGSDLLFTIGEAGQSLLIQGQFAYTSLGYNDRFAPNSRIETFAFRDYADGWSLKGLQQKLIEQSSTDGDDTILGFGDDDEIDAGRGNDTLVGLDGQDTYLWGKGDGNDLIDERALYIDVNVGLGGLSLTASADTVQFKDLNRSDLVFARPSAAPDLVITDTLTGEKLTIHNQFAGFQTGVLGAQWFDRVEWFQFADGSRLSWQDVELIVTTGGAGEDHLYGDILADRLAGGAGNDILSGGGGADTYVFNTGDGHDTISDHDESFLGSGFLTIDPNPDVLQFGAGIRPDDISFDRDGPNVDLIVGSTGDRITLVGQDSYIYTGVFGNLSSTRVEEIRFADGTVWTWHELNQRMIAAATTDGNDVTIGTSTDDVFAASAGDDILDGGDGNDTYAFGRGSDHDIIRDHVDNVLDGEDDTLVFGAGLTLADLGFAANGDDLVITIVDTGDTMRIEGEFGYSAYFTWNDVETFVFADGSSITKADIRIRLLTGTSGNDTLRGFSSNDTYQGNAGDDLLIDRDGNDVYVFNPGDGHDTIEEHVDYVLLGDDDTLRFGVGILPSDIVLSRDGNDLTLSVSGTQDAVTILGQFAMSAWFTWNDVELFTFANGTEWTKDDVSRMLLTSTSGNDVLVGTGGNDLLDGDAGDDELRGGDGSDTYVFGRGYGHDTVYESVDYVLLDDNDQVRFASDVAPADLLYSRDGDDLIVRIAGTDDVLKIVGEFAVQTPYTWTDIERFLFADGTTLSKDDLRQKVLTGTAANDHIIGFGDNDLIDGAGGDDALEGRDGSDTYRFGVGDGHDTVIESLDDGRSSEEDTLAFKSGVAPADVTVTRDGQDAVFTLLSGDSVRVQGQFNEGYNEFLSSNDVEHVTFADGTAWDKVEVDRRSIQATAGDDTMLGSRYAQTYAPGAGNDTVSAGGGDDTLVGGGGDDHLDGDSGNDVYVYNSGDGADVLRDYDYYDNGFNRIRFGVGIDPADLRVSGVPGDGSQMVVSFANAPGSITVVNQWGSNNAIDQFNFADGTIWSIGQIQAAFVAGEATPGDDVVTGTSGADIITGAGGNDSLVGLGGDDIYRFNLGDGQDSIFDRGYEHWWGFEDGGVDAIEFGPGIDPQDVDVVQVSPDDVALRVRGRTDVLTIQGQTSDPVRRIETVRFADGTSWTAGELLAKALAPTAGDDTHYAGYTPSVLAGGEGNDTLFGSTGGDDLTGGPGQDTLYGGGGDDTYRFGRGDGVDTVFDRGPEHWWGFEGGGSDTVVLGSSVSPGQVEVVQLSADDIGLRIVGTTDQLVLSGQISDGVRRIETVQFADGTIWTADELLQRSLTPTPGNDVFYAGYTPSVMGGGAGDDSLFGSNDADTLDGGAGDDLLVGNGGDDIYLFDRGGGTDTIFDRGPAHWWGFEGGGNDTIVLGSTITPADIEVFQVNSDDMGLRVVGTADEIIISGALTDPARRVEAVDFADGTRWSYYDLMALLVPTNPPGWLGGTPGPDSIFGTSQADLIIGNAGNDYLEGREGGDEYRYLSGDGNDEIADLGPSSDTDRLNLADLTPVGVELYAAYGRNETTVWVKDVGTGQSIRLDNQISSDGNWGVEQILFSDGTVWGREQIHEHAWLRGTSSGEQLFSGSAADVLVGGLGDDYLEGNSGGDEYRYASGDGNDQIADLANPTDVDTLRLTDLLPADVELRRDHGRGGITMWVTDKTTGQSIRVDNQFAGDSNWGIERIVFADGTEWDRAAIRQAAWLRGTAGSEQIFSGADPDILVGGRGDDYLEGNSGGDEYRYASGDGNDQIADLANATDVDTLRLTDLLPADVELRRDHGRGGITMWVTDKTTGQSIRVDNQFAGDGSWGIERIVFADETEWDRATIRQAAWLRGTAGAEQIFSGADPDILVGGPGDDYLEGNSGGDEYRYASGDGNDEIADLANSTDIDVLRLQDLSGSQVQLRRSGDDLYVRDETTGQEVRVDHQFAGDGNWGVEQVVTADGITLDRAAILSGAWVRGGVGDDYLDVGNADATYVGGHGNDVLHGHEGADTYVYEAGDGDDYLYDESNSATSVDALKLVGLDPADVTFYIDRSQGDDMFIRVNATGETIKLVRQLGDQEIDRLGWGVDRVQFAGGTVWDRQQMHAAAWFRGGVGNDNLDGYGSLDNSFQGGAGDDVLHGRDGSDTYVYARGDGSDFLYDQSGSTTSIDTLRLTDLNVADLTFFTDSSQGADAFIRINGSTDTIKLAAQYASGSGGAVGYGVDRIEFADGATWDRARLMAEFNTQHVVAEVHGGDDLIATTAAETFQVHAGFGSASIDGFDTGGTVPDVVQFDRSVFADWAHLLGATRQVGTDLMIDVSASDTLTLKNLNLTTFHQESVRLV